LGVTAWAMVSTRLEWIGGGRFGIGGGGGGGEGNGLERCLWGGGILRGVVLVGWWMESCFVGVRVGGREENIRCLF
jgi:hypothetical protein